MIAPPKIAKNGFNVAAKTIIAVVPAGRITWWYPSKGRPIHKNVRDTAAIPKPMEPMLLNKYKASSEPATPN